MNTPTFGTRLAIIEREVRATHRIIADLEKRMRKQESWKWYALCALAAGSNAVSLLKGCA